MSVDKRPRVSTEYTFNGPTIILLNDEDEDDNEPPRKRQKSLDPAKSTYARNIAKPITIISIESSPEPVTNHSNSNKSPAQTPSSKKGVPWKSRQSWSKRLSTSLSPSQNAKVVDHYSHDDVTRSTFIKSAHGNTTEWSPRDNQRLHALSIGLVGKSPITTENAKRLNGAPGTYYTSGSATPGTEDDDQILDKFKLGSVTALKFNPTGSSLATPSLDHSLNGPVVERVKSTSISQPQEQLNRHNHNVAVIKDSKSTTDIRVQIPSKSILHHSQSAHPLSSSVNSTNGSTPAKAQQLPAFSINVPLSDSAKLRRERKALQERLKQGVDYAKNNPKEVKRVLGLRGFFTECPVNLEEQKYQDAAQPRKRMIDRSRVLLELDPGSDEERKLKQGKNKHFVHPKDQAKAILTTRFSEDLNPPLTFSNPINDRRLDGKFQFISEYFLGHGVKATGQIGLPGCSCMVQCGAVCACLTKVFKIGVEKSKREWSEQVPQYERRPDGLVVLRDDFIKRHTIHAPTDSDDEMENDVPRLRTEITECNDRCPCDSSCINRVVQKGRTVPLDIFETGRCGFGVRSPSNLVRGQFIEVYLGEVITENELVRREEAAEAGSISYIYSLDWFATSKYQAYHVDGENFGSAMRFVNHSCEPNAGTFTVLNNKSTKQLHHVAFFALKDIPAGTEITIDYNPQTVGTVYELNAADDGMERCYCGASTCRQMLWPPGNGRKARKKVVGRTSD